MPTSPNPSRCTPMPLDLAWEQSSTRPMMMEWDTIISYASRSLTKAKVHYPVHKLKFITFKWAVVEKFHECLYGLTFDVYTNNNLNITVYHSSTGPMELQQDNQLGILYGFPLLSLSLPTTWVPQREESWEKIHGRH